MSDSRPTVAVLFHRLGPYHYARLRAAGSLLPIVAIESSGVDETYAWDVVAGTDGFERVTLFGNADAQRQPAREVASRVNSALDKISPAVVAIPGWADAAALAALQWCVQNRVPAIVMSESTEWDEVRRVWREAVKRRIVGLFSAALVGGTPHQDYMVKLGMPAERVFPGYDAVDNEYFAENAEKLKTETLKSEGGNRNTSSGLRPPSPQSGEGKLPEKYFLASARFIEKKNLPRLIQAYARYREMASKAENRNQKSEIRNEFQLSAFQISDFSPWPLVLLGDGELRSDLCRLISDLRLQHCVLLPGFKQYPELPTYYGLAGAFIHASTTEQWGLVVNEAMASGLPVLVSNRCGCATDLVQEGVNGFTFDPCDVGQLAQLMSRISDFRFPISDFGLASQRIVSEWGPERFALGLRAAAECALKVVPKRATLMQRMILKALLSR